MMTMQSREPRPLAPLAKRRRLVLLAVGGYALGIVSYLVYAALKPTKSFLLWRAASWECWS